MVVAGGGVGVVGGVVGLLVPAVGQGVGHGGGPAVEPLVERNRRAAAGGVEGQVGHSGNAVGAVGGDIHVICGVGGQSRQIDDGVAGIDHGAGADGESRRTPFDGPAGGVAQLIPHDVGLVRGDVDRGQVVHGRAVGYALHGQVVQVGIAVLVVGRHDGDAGAGDGVGIVGENHGEFLPGAEGAVHHRVDGDEGGLVGGVGDHAHYQAVVVAAVGLVEPETKLQGVDRGCKLGQHHVAPGGAGAVHVHGLAAAGVVVVAGGGIGVVGGVVGLLVPAVGQWVGSGGRPGVESLVER